MNSFIPSLNHAGDTFLRFAAPMALQCAVLVAVLALLDFALKHRVRAALRYGLWLLLLLKLVLPPTLSSPTSAAYWLPAEKKTARPAPPVLATRVEFTDVTTPFNAKANVAPAPPPRPTLRAPAVALLLWAGGVMALGLWLVRRAFFVAGLVRRAQAAPASLQTHLDDCRVVLAFRHRVELRLSPDVAGPAVCGLWRPVILLPARVAEGLPAAQLRSVLLHELAHIRRGDLWVNHAQCLLQILYWWHPLVWLGNAAIRRTREQAVDEQVMLALGRDADDYPATILEIAKAAVPRTALALGLVGILEHRRALKTRIRRLLEHPLPSSATLGPRHVFLILLVALIALPMSAARDRRTEMDAPNLAQIDDGFSPNVAKPDRHSPLQPPVATKKRTMLLRKIDQLRLAEFGATEEPLPNLILRLHQAARAADPGGDGVGICLALDFDPSFPEIDRETGLPKFDTSRESIDAVDRCRLNLPTQTDVVLRQVLDAIVRRAPCSIQYSVTDFGVVFSGQRSPPELLYTRWFKVDPSTFAASMSNMIEGKSSGKPAGQVTFDSATQQPDMEVVIPLLHKLVNKVGVELNPPKSVVFNDRLGMLMIRATLADLDVVEQVIQAVNTVPAQLLIQTTFVEVIEVGAASTEISAVLGFDIAARIGTTITAVQPPNARAKASATQGNLPAPVFTGILTPKQYRDIRAALGQEKGTEFLASPSVLTPSGRQAQIKTVEVKNIVTDLDYSDKHGSEPRPITEPFEFGPSLDVVPSVQPDGFTVNMTMIPTLREFIGYDLELSKRIGAATGITSSIPLPMFRTRQVVASTIVQDGQTVVLGLGAAEAESKSGGPKVRKHLLVFITTTMIDPAGNRVHSEAEMPSPRDRVPPQKSN